MRFSRLLAPALVLAAASAPSALGAAPPNPNDPCIQGTRDSCGTTGIGYYKTYRYGTRWFGDFKNAIPGTEHTYCIDLRFWYPGAAYRYAEDTSGTLTNKDGQAVPLPNEQRIAYAIWVFGRTSDPDQAAAVMLYVHSQMGDARPGELDPRVLGAKVSSLYDRIKDDATRFHGPYRVDVQLPQGLKVGKTATATVRVLTAGGAAVPDVPLTVAGQDAAGVATSVTTNGDGSVKVAFTPSGTGLKLTVAAAGLPSTMPRVFHPTAGPSAVNGQRLVLPSSQTVTASASPAVSKTQIQVSTVAVPPTLLAGGQSRDKVTISSAGTSWKGTIQIRVYGPARTTAAIACTGTPAAETTVAAAGNGVVTTPAVTLTQPGFYAYQEVVPGGSGAVGLTTPCDVASERVRVDTQPKVTSTVSAQTVAPDAQITDTIAVSGLDGEAATVQAALYGPFGSPSAVVCTGTPVWTASIPLQGDGTATTAPFTVQASGYYTYRESIPAAGFVRAAQTACADPAETTVAVGTPRIVTAVSAQRAAPGATITDRAVVSGLGVLQAPVVVQLWGPFATRGGIGCSGTPYWQGSFTARGDGTYTTAKVELTKAGYYSYRETIAAGTAYAAFTAPCAEAAETTFAHAAPTLATQATSEVVRPGKTISDRVRVQGLGKTAARITATLYGPFATRATVGCTGAPAGTTSVTARGDGTVTTPGLRVARAGFYVFRERLLGSPLVSGVLSSCSDQSEVTLAAPLVITGRGDVTREVRRSGAGSLTPTRIRLASLGIDAAVSPVGIDLGAGILGVSPDIHRTGWWKDGALPGDRSGAVLIAGHVDSATAGAGAFFRLHQARAGDRIELRTAGGRTFAYRVVTVRSYPKANLPTSVWSRRGPARLVVVTCGGPFDQATRHYRDNVVVTAVPA